MPRWKLSTRSFFEQSSVASFGDFIEDKSAENPMEEAGFAMLKDKIIEQETCLPFSIP